MSSRSNNRPSSPRPLFAFPRRGSEGGWTLIELVIVITVLTILTMGIIPLARTAVRRQREYRLREALREMREAIKEFHRDTVGAPCCLPPGSENRAPVFLDARSKVAISDRTLFDTRNMDHYPPTLQILVEGVNVVPRLQVSSSNDNRSVVDGPVLSLRKKIYLRRIPDDPTTPGDESSGEAEWGMRSCYDEGDSTSWDGINVFDVYSKSEGTALNGEKYSDW